MIRRSLAVLLVLSTGCAEDGHDHDHDHHTDEGAHTDAVAYEDGVTASTSGGHFQVSLTLSGGATVGTHDVTLELVHHGSAAEGQDVSLEATMPAHGHGTDPVTVTESATAGTYTASGLNLTMAGTWEVTVSVADPDHGGDAVFSIPVE